MRVKAIPTEIVTAVTAHPALVVAAVAAIGVGVYSYTRTSPSNGADPESTGQTMMGYAYGAPMSFGATSGADAGSGGIIDSMSNTAGAALDFEILKENHDYELAGRSLDNQLTIAQLNANIALAGMSANMYNAAANLAQSFMQSGQQFSAGKIGDLTFAFLGSGKTTLGSGKKSRKYQAQQNANFLALLNNSTIQQFLGVQTNVLQPSTGTLSIAPYGSPATSPAMQSGGSTQIASAVSGSYPDSSQSATYNPSAYEATPIGSSGGGTTRSGSFSANSY